MDTTQIVTSAVEVLRKQPTSPMLVVTGKLPAPLPSGERLGNAPAELYMHNANDLLEAMLRAGMIGIEIGEGERIVSLGMRHWTVPV